MDRARFGELVARITSSIEGQSPDLAPVVRPLRDGIECMRMATA